MLANAHVAEEILSKRRSISSIGPLSCLLIGALSLAACEAPPTNASRQWYGDSLRAPTPSGAAPGAMSEGPAGSGSGGRAATGGGGAGGSAAPGSEEEEPEEEEPMPSPNMGGMSGGMSGVDARASDVAPLPATDGGVPMGPAAACQIMVTVTTVTTNRDYAPRNVGAIWVADAGGRFVKSVNVWAGTRANYLRSWVQVTTAAGVARNRTDAITGATLRNHAAPHTGTWNCTDNKGVLMPQGRYQLCMEMTEANATGASRCVPFDHAGAAYDLMLPAHARFINSRITYAAK
jgi:hypothetical protein